MASCHRPSAAAWPGQPATGGDWRRGVEPPTEAGERKGGGGIGRSPARRRRGRSWEDILRRGSGEANRGAQEAAADGVGARSCFCSKRSEPSDGKSDGRHRRVTWPAEEQEVVYI